MQRNTLKDEHCQRSRSKRIFKSMVITHLESLTKMPERVSRLMAKQLVDDALWEVVEPLLPPAPARTSRHGRPRQSDRTALTGILFVLRSGIPWEMLPPEMGCGSGMTCWRRLRDWHRAGVWRKLHELLLSRLEHDGQIDWSRASLDSVSVRAKGAPRKKGARLDRTRRIGANRARNAINW